MMNYISRVWLDGEIIPPEFDFPNMCDVPAEVHFERLFMGPGQTLLAAPVSFDVSKLVDSKQGKGSYYVYGWTEYGDVFDKRKRHRTEFCHRITADGQPSRIGCQFSSSVIGEFNGAEKDCYRKAGQDAPTSLADTPFTPIVR
jgi:hypothetical protein